MKAKQILFLFLALLLPACIFLFLKGFGKNEFNVAPLYQDELPIFASECVPVPSLPYAIAHSIRQGLFDKDSLALILFDSIQPASKLTRVREAYDGYALAIKDDHHIGHEERKCIYFLQEPFDAVLVDKVGRIRGQYDLSDRDEVDRLITELAIIFKKY